MAFGQWYGAGYLGGNITQPADVSIQQPGAGTSLTFQGVHFAARPLEPRQYYGLRLGRRFATRGFGLELEMVHLKAIAKTAEVVTVSGRSPHLAGELPAGFRMLMGDLVDTYSMTHGLNFALVNLVTRQRLGGRLSLVERIGAGPMFPHAESLIAGQGQAQYEYAGIGVGGAAGMEFRLIDGLSGLAEYKLTVGRPTITIVGGTGTTTAVSHHLALGLGFEFPW
jgi:hypothetical protein